MNISTEQAFALKVCIGIVAGFAFVLWAALQESPYQIRKWLDVYLLTVLGAIVGARLGFVVFHPDRFIDLPLNVPRIWFGELAWQGALVGGGLVLLGAGRWRGVSLARVGDGLALALPLVLVAVCWACRSAGLVLGETVSDLSDHPVWMAAFLPDFGRDVAPRYELQMLGVALGAGMLVVAGILTLAGWLSGARIWVMLALLGGVVWLLDALSVERGVVLYGVSMNRVFALIMVLASVERIQNSVSTAAPDAL